MTARLISLSYSPWSEKATWALDHHRVEYARTEYLPMLGEPALRIAMRRLTGRVSVPVLLDGDAVLDDSIDIARHAERVGAGAPLFPVGREAAVREWNARSEAALASARTLVLAKTAASEAARREALPRPLRSALLMPLASQGVAYLTRKYAAPVEALAAERAKIRAALLALRAALGGRRHLLGDDLSYADIAMAVVLQAVAPVDDRYIRLQPATRLCWTDDELARDAKDLVEWRDALYDAHRRAR